MIDVCVTWLYFTISGYIYATFPENTLKVCHLSPVSVTNGDLGVFDTPNMDICRSVIVFLYTVRVFLLIFDYFWIYLSKSFWKFLKKKYFSPISSPKSTLISLAMPNIEISVNYATILVFLICTRGFSLGIQLFIKWIKSFSWKIHQFPAFYLLFRPRKDIKVPTNGYGN